MYIQDLFNPNQKKKLKGNKLVDNSKNLNSVNTLFLISTRMCSMIIRPDYYITYFFVRTIHAVGFILLSKAIENYGNSLNLNS